MFHRWAGGKSTLLEIHDNHMSITLTHLITGTINIMPRKDREMILIEHWVG
jgi:hypothetical protein